MTQRIFDVDNPQDVKDLFDILPDKTQKICLGLGSNETEFYNKDGLYVNSCAHIRINWRNKKEIARPVDESKWLGCLCWFVGVDGSEHIGVLHAVHNGDDSDPYVCKNGILRSFKHCRPVRRNEIKFVEDME